MAVQLVLRCWRTKSVSVKMGIYADDVAEFTRKGKNRRKLGDALAGRFSDLEIDSVEEVRKLRERE